MPMTEPAVAARAPRVARLAATAGPVLSTAVRLRPSCLTSVGRTSAVQISIEGAGAILSSRPRNVPWSLTDGCRQQPWARWKLRGHVEGTERGKQKQPPLTIQVRGGSLWWAILGSNQ